jgi:hypothetical protein
VQRSDAKGLALVLAALVVAFFIHVAESLYNRPVVKMFSMPATAMLDFAAPCAAAITITPAAGQSDFTITAKARHKAEISNISTASGADASIGHAGDCPDDPSLTLNIGVPAGTRIMINDPADTDYHIGAGVAALSINSSGSGDVHAGSTGRLTALLSGSGDLDAGDVGNADLTLSGDGDASLDQVTGNLKAVLSDDGDLKIGTVTGDAALTMSGDGDVTIPKLGGHLTETNTGDGDLHVNGS